MKFIKLASITVAAIIFGIGITTCSKDENNDDNQENVEFADKGKSFEFLVGDKVELNVTGLSSQKEYILQIEDIQIEYNIFSISDGVLKFQINKKLSGIIDKKLILKHEGKVVAEGPSLSVKKTYAINKGANGIAPDYAAPMSITSDNTVNIRTSFYSTPPRLHINTALFKGNFLANQLGHLDMERSGFYVDISSIEVPNNGKWGFAASIRNTAMATRNDIIYVPMFYTLTEGNREVPYYRILMREKNGQVKPFGGDIERYKFEDGIFNICVDSKGILYVVEWGKNCIYQLDPSKQGGKILWAGSETESASVDGTGTNARFSSINYLNIDSNDNIYLVENSKIRKITPDRKVSTLAGKDETGDVVGDINSALFNKIKGMAIGKDNSIYVLDGENEVLKIISQEQTKVFSYPIKDSRNFVFSDSRQEMPMQVDTNGIVYFVSKQDLYAIVPDNLWPD